LPRKQNKLDPQSFDEAEAKEIVMEEIKRLRKDIASWYYKYHYARAKLYKLVRDYVYFNLYVDPNFLDKFSEASGYSKTGLKHFIFWSRQVTTYLVEKIYRYIMKNEAENLRDLPQEVKKED